MGARVAVAGASGYAGGELLRLLAAHPDIEIGPVAAASSAGRPVTDVHPHLSPAGRPGLRAAPHAAPLSGADLVFLALPAGESAALAAQLPGPVEGRRPGPRLQAGRPGRLGQVLSRPARRPVGLRAARAARRPGPDPGRRPGRRTGLLRHGGDPGPGAAAGRGPGRAVRHRDRGRIRNVRRRPDGPARAARQRGDGRGQRVPGRRRAPAHARDRAGARRGGRRWPGVADGTPQPAEGRPRYVDRGRTGRRDPSRSASPRCWPRCRAASWPPARPGWPAAPAPERSGTRSPAPTPASRSCALLPEGSWPTTAATAGSNAVHLQVAADQHAGRAVAVAALDNLGKGAAGQAVQCANLMLGLPETAGLTANGVAP